MTATHRAWRLHAFGDLRSDVVPTPEPHATGVIVRIETAMVLSYTAAVIDGTLRYALPPMPFVPGTNAIATVTRVGTDVHHLRPGHRVFVSPHLVADERARDPAQILIGHTAMGRPESLSLQARWPDGVFAEYAHLPAAVATPLVGLEDDPAERLIGLAKLVVPYGGLVRGRLAPGETMIVNGANGYYGSAAVLVGLAMGAARIVAVVRRPEAAAALAALGGGRIHTVGLRGEVEADAAAIREASGGGADLAFDIVGQAETTDATLACLKALRRGGRLVLMGSAKAALPVSFGEMLANNWEILGHFMYRREDPARLAAMAAARTLDLGAVRVTSFPFDALPEAIAHAGAMRGLDLTALAP